MLAISSRSSSPFPRRSSPHEAQSPSFASLTAAADTRRGRLKRGFFNEIDVKRILRIAAVNVGVARERAFPRA
jgi:hypothetical protein